MSDDLTVMGIAATAAAAMGRAFADCSRALGGSHPACGQPGCRDRPEAEPRPCVALALPGRCLQVGFERHQQRLVRDRGLRSPTLCRRLLDRAGRRSWRRSEERAMPQGGADPPQAVGQSGFRCRARWRHSSRRDLRRPKGPKVPSWPPAVRPAWSTSDPLHGAIQFRLHRIALALLATSRGVDPADRFHHVPLLGAGRSLRPTCGATEVAPARHQKPQNDLTLARHRPSGWPSPSGPAGKAWPGENVDEPSSPAFTTGSRCANSNFLLKIIGHVPGRPPWTLRLSQFCVQGNRVRLTRQLIISQR